MARPEYTRNREELEKLEYEYLASYALKSDKAKGGRAYPEDSRLDYRTQFHRDRDRIIWCRSFKRLQHKTQIFPVYCADHFRRRLTHSLEVSQIATTIARSLKLNETAAEAMALGHDIGHAPFGHAGENALNKELDRLKKESNLQENRNLFLYQFDHAIQGIETVERIEKEYQNNYHGLNLTFDVREGILKHRRFEPSDPCLNELRLDDIIKRGLYKQFGLNRGSLEAQCVLFADKLAYFFADFEDALRSHILGFTEIDNDPFGNFKNIINEILKSHDYKGFYKPIKNIDSFLEFRRIAISALILNTIDSSKNRIIEKKLSTIDDVRTYKKRIINIDERHETVYKNTYNHYIKEKVFSHELYMATEFKAEKIIKDMFGAYYSEDKLVPADYKQNSDAAYGNLNLEPDELKILCVKNYIAGMTDSFVMSRHKDLFMSSEQILIG